MNRYCGFLDTFPAPGQTFCMQQKGIDIDHKLCQSHIPRIHKWHRFVISLYFVVFV